MKQSTKHLILQRLIGLLAVIVFLGATKIWEIPYVNSLPEWVGIFSLVVLFVVMLSGMGMGPWGQAVNKMIIREQHEYRSSLKPAQPRDREHDV